MTANSDILILLLAVLAMLILVKVLPAVVQNRRSQASNGRVAVRCLGGRGRSVPQIARELGLSQDAVRALVGPDRSVRRGGVPGNSFRSRSEVHGAPSRSIGVNRYVKTT